MAKKLSKLQLAQQETEVIVKKTNAKIVELGVHSADLDASLNTMQSLLNRIRNMPEENVQRYREQEKVRIKWKQQAKEIELEYKRLRYRQRVKVQPVLPPVLLLQPLVPQRPWELRQHSV